MGDVLKFPRKYEPTNSEKLRFALLQAHHQNYRDELRTMGLSEYQIWESVQRVANLMRAKLELVHELPNMREGVGNTPHPHSQEPPTVN